MTRPSPAEIRSWAPGAWVATADGLAAAASEFTRAGARALEDVQNLGFEQWSGRGRRACETAVAESSGFIRRAAVSIEEAADACRRAADQIGPIQEALISTYEALICSNYSVSDNWTVRDQLFGPFDPLSGPDAQLARERESEALNETVRLQQLADTAGFTDADTARNLRTLLISAHDALPSAFGFSASSADGDVDALLHGTATAEERTRFLEATSLGAAREVEGDIVISKSQMDYLEALLLRLEDKGIGAYHFLGQDDEAVREQLVSTLCFMADSRLRTDELVPVVDSTGPGTAPHNILAAVRRAGDVPPLAREILDEQKDLGDSVGIPDVPYDFRGPAFDAATAGTRVVTDQLSADLAATGRHAPRGDDLRAIAPDLKRFGVAVSRVGGAMTVYDGFEEWATGQSSAGKAAVGTAAALGGGAITAGVVAAGIASAPVSVPVVVTAGFVGLASAGGAIGGHEVADTIWDAVTNEPE